LRSTLLCVLDQSRTLETRKSADSVEASASSFSPPTPSTSTIQVVEE
jgi:hypothetical protein